MIIYTIQNTHTNPYLKLKMSLNCLNLLLLVILGAAMLLTAPSLAIPTKKPPTPFPFGSPEKKPPLQHHDRKLLGWGKFGKPKDPGLNVPMDPELNIPKQPSIPLPDPKEKNQPPPYYSSPTSQSLNQRSPNLIYQTLLPFFIIYLMAAPAPYYRRPGHSPAAVTTGH